MNGGSALLCLAAAEPTRVNEMRTMIRQRFTGLKSRAMDQDLPGEMRKQLEALGYVAAGGGKSGKSQKTPKTDKP